MSDKPIPAAEWDVVVRNVPIVSVDLVVERGEKVLLGKRTNEPAKGEWFVPGGRVHKHERLADAVQRVARAELGTAVEIVDQLGVYQHFWDVADTEDADGKHYVPIGYHVRLPDGDVQPDAQHADLRWFEPPFEFELHPYVEQYLTDAGVLSD